jgi:hypothetical protein
MNKIIYTIGTNEERQALASRSAKLLLTLAERSMNYDKLAQIIYNDALVRDVLAGKHTLPIPGLQWLREIESENGEIDWYTPSLLWELAIAFQSHTAGALSLNSETTLNELESRVLDVLKTSSGS